MNSCQRKHAMALQDNHYFITTLTPLSLSLSLSPLLILSPFKALIHFHLEGVENCKPIGVDNNYEKKVRF